MTHSPQARATIAVTVEAHALAEARTRLHQTRIGNSPQTAGGISSKKGARAASGGTSTDRRPDQGSISMFLIA